ncbi:S-methyl-5'-thioadenosine phosphorylase [Leucoagaricus sp. SymC.cos]|nr:S-methyl-5'-thioadenosine phosphorylase [Leucoagaricus sp. SymC.cos]
MQIIDRTKGIRPTSFFEKTSIVAHAGFGDPFSNGLVKWLESRVARVLEKEGRGVKLFSDKCIVVMEGPQFSTRAESLMYRQWGGDLINMSTLPEAKLAREAELSYALIATATDFDSWREQEEVVTAAEVLKTLKANADTARLVAETILDDLQAAITDPNNGHIFLEEVGKMKFSIMPHSIKQKAEDREKLAYVLPEYFGDEEGDDVTTT